MVYASTKTLLIKIVQSLDEPGEVVWEDQIESGNDCLFELHQMTRPSVKADQVNLMSPTKRRVDVNVALVHAKAMVRAIRRKDRAGALTSGRAAIDAM
jgi:hypothetical protein